jgi:hypothetical protein
MQETLVSFRVAELVKKKGFTNGSNHYFELALTESIDLETNDTTGVFGWKKGECNAQSGYHINSEQDNQHWFICERPSQDLLQKWLREVHNISICIYPVLYEWEVSLHTCHKRKKLPIYLNPNNSIHGKTYEEAREEALFQTLNLLSDV